MFFIALFVLLRLIYFISMLCFSSEYRDYEFQIAHDTDIEMQYEMAIGIVMLSRW